MARDIESANQSSRPFPGGTVIEVSPVTPAASALPEIDYKDAVEARIRPVVDRFDPEQVLPHFAPIEACSAYGGRLVERIHMHPLVAAVHLAFDEHRPLALSPDMLWLVVMQGLSHHIRLNAESLRSQFVSHSGQLLLEVERHDFFKGSLENPWPEVFDAFSSQIRTHIGDATHDMLVPTFTTTGPVERAAAQVALIDAMRSYFEYLLLTRCGIPRITLEGTADDWEELATRVRGLAQYDLEWWTSALGPILDEFVVAARGKPNVAFWRSIYRLNDVSGGPYISGWIAAFFPYLKDPDTGIVDHPYRQLLEGGTKLEAILHPIDRKVDWSEMGPSQGVIPNGWSCAPFNWDYFGRIFKMEFLSGFVGVRQDTDTLTLRPEIGWAVRDATPA